MDYDSESNVCGKRSCAYVIVDDEATCTTGDGSCNSADCLEAEPSGFHDQHLIEATRKIREILAAIPADPQGRTLSFLHTRQGSLLAWVRQSSDEVKQGVTAKDDDEKIAKALKLKKRAAAGAN